MNIKILGISGSPRKEANTDTLVKKALDACKKNGADTEFISLAGKEIKYCDYCDACTEKTGYTCPKTDDVAGILEAMKAADAIIIGSPTYFASVSGQLKTLFDRTLPLRRNAFQLSGKVGGAIGVGGSRNGGQENVVRDIQNWMLVHEMIVVGDKKTAHFGGISVARRPGDAEKDELGLTTSENLGIKVYETVSRIKKP
jgi:multimeric flavodoxin WrbA